MFIFKIAINLARIRTVNHKCSVNRSLKKKMLFDSAFTKMDMSIINSFRIIKQPTHKM
jgi:hypothetical protein